MRGRASEERLSAVIQQEMLCDLVYFSTTMRTRWTVRLCAACGKKRAPKMTECAVCVKNIGKCFTLKDRVPSH